MPDTKLVEIK